MVKRVLFIVLLLIGFQVKPVIAAGPAKVMIYPFSVHGAGEYLGPGLASMIASRLGATGDIRVIPAGEKGTVDYALKGSVTAIGKSYSLDIRLEPATEGAEGKSFFAAAAGEDALLGAVDNLSAEIRAALGGVAVAKKPVQLKSGASENTARNIHPGRMFVEPVASPAAPALSLAASRKIMGVKRFDKSGNIRFGAAAMAMGDVDGDGAAEVIFATPRIVRVYRLKGHELLFLAGIDIPSRTRMNNIDAVDLDGDGRDEILVSGNDEWTPDSLIIDFAAKKLVIRAASIPWFIRSLKLADGEVVLAGQKSGFDKPLGRKIYHLRFTGTAVEKVGRIKIPLGLDMFALAFADIDGDHNPEIIAVDQSDRLSVYRMDGRLLWRSSDHFAGINRFLGGDREVVGFAETDDAPGAREYLATRILVADVNDDGVDEVVVNRNPGNFSRIMARSRMYSGGEINVLAWNGIGMASIWKSPAMEGYVIGNRLMKNGDKLTCVVGLVLKTGWLDKLKADETTLLFFDLNF